MSSNNPIRTRSERVATLQLEPSAIKRQLTHLLAGNSLIQLLIAGTSIVLLLVSLQVWTPPFHYREGQVPDRDIVARVAFDLIDAQQTKLLRDQRRRETLCYYENRSQAISQLRSTLQTQLFALLSDKTSEELSPEQRNLVQTLLQDIAVDGSPITVDGALKNLRVLLVDRDQLNKFGMVIQAILGPISETGILKSLGHDSDQGNQRSIMVIPAGSQIDEIFVDVSSVLRAEVVANLPSRVSEVFQREFGTPESLIVGKMVANFLVNNLPETLSYRGDLSEKARRNSEAAVPEATVSYFPTVSRLATAGQPITQVNQLPLLRAEYQAWLQQLGAGFAISRVAAFAGILLAIYTFGAFYIHYCGDTKLLKRPESMLRLLGLVVVTCLVCRLAAHAPSRAELVPMVVTSIVMAFTFGRQIAILVSTSVALIVVWGLGLGMIELATMLAGCWSASLLLGRIRNRSKLIYVGLATGGIVLICHLWMDVIDGRFASIYTVSTDSDLSLVTPTSNWPLLVILGDALRSGGFALLASALVAGFLPVFEKVFGVQTDLRLLELGDASHPLLRQLAQRAPGTYNHSINVAAIAEAAADSIGAHGLLARVGAYFHDIGKIFKPNYFIENQDASENCHDSLQPAMSTLVIIAHVKDGADLARQHNLPLRIVQFIEQHHGTTLVEYFYREATKRSQEDPNKEDVSETAFRYPGPKPQTVEAAVLMLADAVESASRTLVEPTASRLQSLVEKIAMKKLMDGQFDECGLTLKQLDMIKTSLVKSLTSIYHGRISYTGQASA